MGWDMSQKVTHKKCNNKDCSVGGMQPFENFCKSKATLDGYNHKCRICTRASYAEYAAKRKLRGDNETKREEYNGTMSSYTQRQILHRVSRTLSKTFFLTDTQLTLNL